MSMLANPLVGRGDALAALLDRTRVLRHSHISLVGLGGVGKTRLVAELLTRQPVERAVWMTLDEQTTTAHFWGWLCDGLELPDPDDLDLICDTFWQSQTWLIVDDAHHASAFVRVAIMVLLRRYPGRGNAQAFVLVVGREHWLPPPETAPLMLEGLASADAQRLCSDMMARYGRISADMVEGGAAAIAEYACNHPSLIWETVTRVVRDQPLPILAWPSDDPLADELLDAPMGWALARLSALYGERVLRLVRRVVVFERIDLALLEASEGDEADEMLALLVAWGILTERLSRNGYDLYYAVAPLIRALVNPAPDADALRLAHYRQRAEMRSSLGEDDEADLNAAVYWGILHRRWGEVLRLVHALLSERNRLYAVRAWLVAVQHEDDGSAAFPARALALCWATAHLYEHSRYPSPTARRTGLQALRTLIGAPKTVDDTPDALIWLALAELSLSDGQPVPALEAARHAVSQEAALWTPLQRARARQALGMALVWRGTLADQAEAIAHLESALMVMPPEREALVRSLAWAHLRLAGAVTQPDLLNRTLIYGKLALSDPEWVADASLAWLQHLHFGMAEVYYRLTRTPAQSVDAAWAMLNRALWYAHHAAEFAEQADDRAGQSAAEYLSGLIYREMGDNTSAKLVWGNGLRRMQQYAPPEQVAVYQREVRAARRLLVVRGLLALPAWLGHWWRTRGIPLPLPRRGKRP
jgi:hypothetical protein